MLSVETARRHSIMATGSNSRRQSFAVSFDVKDGTTGNGHERRDSQSSQMYRRKASFYGIFGPIDVDDELKKDDSCDEEKIRRKVFGTKLLDIKLGSVDTSVSRPTIASARRSVLWSRERVMYEENNKKDTKEFCDRPYMYKQYPELKKHYPGTWRVANQDEMEAIIKRLTRGTFLSRIRSAPPKSRRYQMPFVVRTVKSAPPV